MLALKSNASPSTVALRVEGAGEAGVEGVDAPALAEGVAAAGGAEGAPPLAGDDVRDGPSFPCGSGSRTHAVSKSMETATRTLWFIFSLMIVLLTIGSADGVQSRTLRGRNTPQSNEHD